MRILTVLAGAALLAGVLAACGSAGEPRPSADRRAWSGPSDTVASRGITTYDRREIAQKVDFPACITAGPSTFKFSGVRNVAAGAPAPAAVFDTGYGLDRWRLLAPSGALDAQAVVFVTVRGSTGIIGEYPRLAAGASC